MDENVPGYYHGLYKIITVLNPADNADYILSIISSIVNNNGVKSSSLKFPVPFRKHCFITTSYGLSNRYVIKKDLYSLMPAFPRR